MSATNNTIERLTGGGGVYHAPTAGEIDLNLCVYCCNCSTHPALLSRVFAHLPLV